METLRHRLLRGCAGLLLGLALAVFPLRAGALGAARQPDHIALTWTRDARMTQTITWRTATGAAAPLVEYGTALPVRQAGDAAKQIPAVTTELETAVGTVLIHSATLTGLRPGTRYWYRVGDGEFWSGEYSFITAPAQPEEFTFLVFGDSQSTDYTVWQNTAAAALRAVPTAAFFVSVGDLVDVGQDYGQWEAWFAGAAGLIDNIPAVPVVGNHETYTPERQFSLPLYFTAQFRLPDNGPPALKGQVYSFDYGAVHFVVLDSQAGEEAEFVPDMLPLERQWLEGDLAATEKPWKVVFIHRPLYGNKPNGVNENLQRAFADVFTRYGVDVVFTAHDHVVARTWTLDAAGNAAVPGEGTVFVATGRSGTKTYSNVEAKAWNEFFLNPVEEPTFLVIRVQGGRLRFQARTQSGGLLDEWQLDKIQEKREGHGFGSGVATTDG